MDSSQQTTNPQPTAAPQPVTGFEPIPTRIRDLPPLVVEPVSDEPDQAVVSTLIELGVKLAEVHRTAAEAYLSQGLFEPALSHLVTATTFAPAVLEYHNQLGFVRYLQGDDQGAIESFQAVLAGQADNSEASFNMGMVLFGQEKYAEAEGCFQKSLQGNPNDSQTWNNRGACLFQLGLVGDAKACFQQALQVDPGDEDAKFNLSSIEQ